MSIIYYYSLTKLILKNKIDISKKIYELSKNNIGSLETIFNKAGSLLSKLNILDPKRNHRKWLTDNSCEEFIPVLESVNIRGNMSVLKSLSTLNDSDRSEQKKLVLRGRPKSSVQKLERAIKQIIKEFKDDEEKEAQRKKDRDERDKKFADEKKQKKQKDEENKKRILQLRKENALKEKEEKNNLDKLKQQDKGSVSLKEPVVEDTKEDKSKKVILTKDEKSFYEMLFGKTETKKIVKGRYSPTDKRILKIDEDKLEQYKDYEKKIKSQKKEMTHMKQNYKKQLTSFLKKIEFQERIKQEIFEAKQRDIKYLSNQIDKKSEENLKIIQEKKNQLKQIQKDIHEQQLSLKKTKLSPENKKQINRMLKKYDGSPDSLLNIITKIRLLTKKKKKNMRVKKTKRKHKPSKGDIIIAEKPRDILISSN